MRLKPRALIFLTILIFLPASANSEDFCVSTATDFQTALTQAQENDEWDVIKLVQNVYVGNFLYASTKGQWADNRGWICRRVWNKKYRS